MITADVTDQLAITALLNRYARAVDGKDWDLYRSVFTDDAYIDYSSVGAIAAADVNGDGRLDLAVANATS